MGYVALINNHSFTTGTGRYAFDLYRAIAKIRPFFVDFYYQIQEFLDANEVHKLLSLNPDAIGTEYSNIGILKNVKNVAYLQKLYKQYKLLHFSEPPNFVLIAGWVGFFCDEKIIFTIHDLPDYFMYLKEDKLREIKYLRALWLFNRISSSDSWIISPTKYLANQLREKFNFRGKKIVVIPFGVDQELFKPRDKLATRHELGLKDDAFIILNISAPTPNKNVEGAIRIAHEVIKEERNVYFIRIGRLTPSQIITASALRDKLIYIPSVPASQIAKFYNAADVLLLPSIKDGASFTLWEAISSCLPIVATDYGPVPEVVGNCGFTYNPFDIQKFVESIILLKNDKDLYREIQNRELARRKEISLQSEALNTLRLYACAIQSL